MSLEYTIQFYLLLSHVYTSQLMLQYMKLTEIKLRFSEGQLKPSKFKQQPNTNFGQFGHDNNSSILLDAEVSDLPGDNANVIHLHHL